MPEASPFLWTGNHPATDLCNTEPVIDGERVELLADFDAVVRWANLAGIAWRARWSDAPERGAPRPVGFVRRLRAALRSALDPTAAGSDAIHALNDVLREAPGVLQAGRSSGNTDVSLAATGGGAAR